MDPRTGEQLIAEIGAARQGVVTAELASATGVPWSVLDHHRRDGRLVRVGRGVYRLRDHPWTWEAQVRAALIASRSAGSSRVGISRRRTW